jgi:peptidoglycan/LPS O-acetylase OafA/YrhL
VSVGVSEKSEGWRNPRLASRIPELDGVRGLAILLVLVWHFAVSKIHPEPGSWQEYALIPLRLTWCGVDLFFVLSGFLIGGILVDAKESGDYYRTFYFRRAHRILPVYFVWTALFVVGLLLVEPASAPPLHRLFNDDVPVWCYPLFVQNFFMSSRQLFGAEWLGITWSLAVEEQFYVLLPFLVRNVSRRRLGWVAAISVVCAPMVRFALYQSGNTSFGPYTLLPSRADALGFGVLIALACRHHATWTWLDRHRRYVHASFLSLGCAFALLAVNPRDVQVWGLTLIAGFCASLLVLVLVEPGRIEGAFFRFYPLARLGTVAYAVYLFHQGTNGLVHFAILGREPSVADWPSRVVTLVALAIVLLLAAMSWRLLEEPLIRRAHSRYRYGPHPPALPIPGSSGQKVLHSSST